MNDFLLKAEISKNSGFGQQACVYPYIRYIGLVYFQFNGMKL